MATKLTDNERDRAADVVAWFSVLIHSWLTHDFREAAHARDELDAQGVRVKLPRQLAKREAKGAPDAK